MFLRKQNLGRMLMKVIAIALTVAMIFPSSLSDVVDAAAKAPKLSITKTKKLVVGKKLNLSVKNKIKGSNYTWSSNNKKVATVTKKGVVKALKVGKAKITCKVKAPKKTYTLKGTIKVVDKSASNNTVVDTVTVATQDELTKALANKDLKKLTIETSNEVNFDIPQGTYSNIDLVVNAPKADVTNSAVFKSIRVDEIKASTWTEKAKGNSFDFRATEGRLVIATGAEVKNLALRGAKATIVADGAITGKVTVAAAVIVEFTGDGTAAINVVVEVAGAKITTSIAIDLSLVANAEVIFEKGSEDSKVTKTDDNVKETITNNTDATIEVKEDVKGEEPTTPTTPGGSSSSGSTSGSGTGSNAVTKVAIKAELNLYPSGSAIVGAVTSEQLIVTVLPTTATNKDVSWTSSDEKIAIVDGNGKVTAVTTTTGSAIITATSKADPSKFSECKVTVEVKEVNFDFEDSIDGWKNGGGGNAELSSEQKKSGQQSLKISGKSDGSAANNYECSADIPFANLGITEADKEYNYSFWVYTSNPSAATTPLKIQLTSAVYVDKDTGLTVSSGNYTEIKLNEWVQVKGKIKANAEKLAKSKDGLRIQFYIENGTIKHPGSFYIDDVKITP